MLGSETLCLWNGASVSEVDLKLARLGYGLFGCTLARLKVGIVVQQPPTGFAMGGVIRILNLVLQFSVRPRRTALEVISDHKCSCFCLGKVKTVSKSDSECECL